MISEIAQKKRHKIFLELRDIERKIKNNLESQQRCLLYISSEHNRKNYEYLNKQIETYESIANEGDIDYMCALAKFYKENETYEKMKLYYLMAIDKGDVESMLDLGFYYKIQNNKENMLKFYLMASNKDNPEAHYKLAEYYDNINDMENMIKYCLMVIEYYKKRKNVKLNSTEYYMLKNSIFGLTNYYNKVVDKNSDLIIEYLNLGCELNVIDSKNELMRLMKIYSNKKRKFRNIDNYMQTENQCN